MKREYMKPIAKYIDYSYDEQVVATSSKVDGLGDGHKIFYCTYESAEFSNPCNAVHNSNEIVQNPDRCVAYRPWSLR